MEDRRMHPPNRSSASRPAWPSLGRPPSRFQRDLVGVAHWSAVARHALPIRFVPNGASAIPELGQIGSHGGTAAGVGGTPQRGRWFGSERMLRGRNFCSGQKRGLLVGKTKRGKGTKIMAIADGHGFPIALRTDSASPAEVKLVEATILARVVEAMPERIIGDKAYDSDGLDRQMAEEYGIEVIAPNRKGRKVATQDGRPLRRYHRRWKVERLFAWLYNFRRLVVRYEYNAGNFQGFLHLAAALILLRHI